MNTTPAHPIELTVHVSLFCYGRSPITTAIPIEEQLLIERLKSELEVATSHYTELLEYFKHLVWLTGGALTIVLLVGGYIFHSNLQDTLKNIREDATKVAIEEA
jgi:hypothetical protein